MPYQPGERVGPYEIPAFIGLAAVVGILTWSSLLACGDKFLVVSRGTRYQRPKNARAANVLIYANPASDMPALKNLPVESVLKHEGHRSTRVETPEQLSAILAGGRFDVVLASTATRPLSKSFWERARRRPLCFPSALRRGQGRRVRPLLSSQGTIAPRGDRQGGRATRPEPQEGADPLLIAA